MRETRASVPGTAAGTQNRSIQLHVFLCSHTHRSRVPTAVPGIDAQVSRITFASNCLRSVLEQIAAYGQVVFRLQRFMDDVTGHCADNPLPGTLPTAKKGTESPFRTYQAFMWALYKYFMSFKEELTEIEKCIINKDETITLAMVVNKLAPRLAQLKVLHKVFSTGIAEVPPDTRNVVRASHLLNTCIKLFWSMTT
ncbi:unnamed protein product [Ranitomeya imitator]|uniref:Gamma-tubulin complex component n=1 Tax=Ranitomeya imitator TaxID=111125 RepID=A0ABN9MCM3_9NEOB|nr:unnamed protein product [Ranitomeya imitator]